MHYLQIITMCIAFLSFAGENKNNSHNDCSKIYFDTKKKVKLLTNYFQVINFQKGDTIASIGASNGWFEGAASVYYDSLIFYLEDIDTTCLNLEQLNKMIKLYSNIKGKKINNEFILIVGEKTKTNLPTYKFDKVIMNMTYHHLTNKSEMLSEIKRIIKNDGVFFVLEAIIPESQLSKFHCPYYSNQEMLLKEIESEGFNLADKKEISSGTWAFMFKINN